MDHERLRHIKRRIIIALFSDDEFMDRLVVRGGNAVDLVHGIAQRASIDLDFSLDSDFPDADANSTRRRIESLLTQTFVTDGLVPFDVRFEARPPEVSADMADFWGGYRLEFKLVASKTLSRYGHDEDELRKRAIESAAGHHRIFNVDFSRHEFCASKREWKLDGFTIYVYSPEMIVCEKLRALCQQMPEYRAIVRSQPPATGRAKDFFDIHTVVTQSGVDVASGANEKLLRDVFGAKRVPLSLLARLGEYREFHRAAFPTVRDTVKPGVKLMEFDFYFDFVLKIARSLKALWKE